MAKIIVITGTPGAGKTAVVTEALKNRTDINVTNYAENMLAVGAELGLGGDHDAIRKLPIEQQKELQRKAAKKIAEEANGTTIVDTHATIKTAEGYLPGLPEWVVSELKPEYIVIIDADAEEINGRRQSDPTRKRDDEGVEGIKKHQEVNLEAAQTAASLCKAEVKVIYNHDNKLEDAAKDLLALLE